MKASELRALTRARRGQGSSEPSSQIAPSLPQIPDSKGARTGWPDGRYDGLRRLRLKSVGQGCLADDYRRDYRGAVKGDAARVEEYRAAVLAIGNENMRVLADRVFGEGEILWNLMGGDRQRYDAAKAALMIALSRLRSHYEMSGSLWSYRC